MNKRNPDLLQKARDYAFLLLKFRSRSEKEISARLKNKKFPEEIISQVVFFLREKKFLDDTAFARAWVNSRIKRPLGLRRIREELKAKGIAQEIIESQLRQVKEDYSEEEIVAGSARAKFDKSKGLLPQDAKRRIYAYLLRRGFSADVVSDALSQL